METPQKDYDLAHISRYFFLLAIGVSKIVSYHHSFVYLFIVIVLYFFIANIGQEMRLYRFDMVFLFFYALFYETKTDFKCASQSVALYVDFEPKKTIQRQNIFTKCSLSKPHQPITFRNILLELPNQLVYDVGSNRTIDYVK